MSKPSGEIETMLKSGQLERVKPNTQHARDLVDIAKRHVDTAKLLATTDDIAMAFTAAYDGARKALSSVLAVEGLRVRPVGGAHRNTGRAAGAFVAGDSLKDFEWMRQIRNATEYPSSDRPTASSQDLDEAIDASAAIVEICAVYVRERFNP